MELKLTIESEPPNEQPYADEQRYAELDEQSVVALAKHDPQALSFLYRQHYTSIHCYVQRRIGNGHDTNDIVAEVFVAMVRYLPRFRWTGAPFRCWLLALTTSQINRWIRRQRFSRLWRPFVTSEQRVSDPQVVSDPQGVVDERVEPMKHALMGLPLSFQTVLTLYYFEDLSVEAIAQIVKCAPGTVKSRLSRGRELLRQKLTNTQEKHSHERRPIGHVLKKSEI